MTQSAVVSTSKPLNEVPAGKSFIAILDKTGDTKILWSKDNEDEVETAKASFDRLVGRGYAAFRVTGKDGAQGEQMHEFDPDAERVILVPALQGG